MFYPGCNVFLLIPDGLEERVLHQGVVVEAKPNSMVVAKFNDPIQPQIGDNVFLHAEHKNKFMQQAAQVQAVLRSDLNPMFAFELSGQPISAESRSVYRVSVTAANLRATINGGSDKYHIQDVSATGFSVHTKTMLKLGEVLDAAVEFGGQGYSGQVRVQSARALRDGRMRYGLHALEQRGGTRDNLQKGLGQISATVQREQLRRLARA